MNKLLKYKTVICSLLLAINLQAQEYANLVGRIIRVIDGDTIVLLSNETNKEYTIRLKNIDAPEKNQEYGKEATAQLEQLLSNQQIYTVCTGKSDKYGRLLCSVFNSGFENINEKMVASGHAWAYGDNSKANKKFKELEEKAKNNRYGLWQSLNPIAPSLYRENPKEVAEKQELATSYTSSVPSYTTTDSTPKTKSKPKKEKTTSTAQTYQYNAPAYTPSITGGGSNQVYVKPYTRSDGTQVRGHYRSKPSK